MFHQNHEICAYGFLLLDFCCPMIFPENHIKSYGFQLKLHKLHGISGGCFESIDFLHKPGGYYPVITGMMNLMATKRLGCWRWFLALGLPPLLPASPEDYVLPCLGRCACCACCALGRPGTATAQGSGDGDDELIQVLESVTDIYGHIYIYNKYVYIHIYI